jgi:hypothetical protein
MTNKRVNDKEIQQNLENIEKYLMIAQLENEKMKKSGKPSSTKLRSFLKDISKECVEARKLSLGKSKDPNKVPKKTAKKEPKDKYNFEEFPETLPQEISEQNFVANAPTIQERKKAVPPRRYKTKKDHMDQLLCNSNINKEFINAQPQVVGA